uniref:NADH-ubiquinone oxidoreductase chain 4L n=1 Tax=Notospermus geniculatus TaxID=416868 RepID=A0A4Y5RV88_9BILA|nr:NADH dehydrogenase subunit 4L [Notospermus geniculatus]QCZ36414.1 NADH dehydrogenase subunit 4L [Notospermus geniculatus]
MFVSMDLGLGFVSIMLILSAFVGLFVERGHLLMVLLLFEAVVLGLFSMLLFGLGGGLSGFYLCLVLVSFGACEAAVGLSLLVSLIRTHGNDFVSALTVYEC